LNVIQNNKELQNLISSMRKENAKIAFVPTMGNLHKGHLSLIELAKKHANYVIVSIFVNPIQFNDDDDFNNYPRTVESDIDKLNMADVDLLFLPSQQDLFPLGTKFATQIHIPEISDDLCGRVRPGHFEGVASVVLRLFNIVKPDIAIFGQKDFQQKLLIERMISDLALNIKIITAPIIREADGLAMSSRNQFLSASKRHEACNLYRVIKEVQYDIHKNFDKFSLLEKNLKKELTKYGFSVDYIAIRSSINLNLPEKGCKNLIVLVSAIIDNVRLIDNILIDCN
jgi:pantoate--beta-alanine ligase